MADSPRKRRFLADLQLPFVEDYDNKAKKQVRLLHDTLIPLSISLRSANESKVAFRLPFVPQDQTEYPSDARCVLQVWELDRWKRRVSGEEREKDFVDKENELLGEIQGFIKRQDRWKFIFLTDDHPEAPPGQSDQGKGRITIKIPQLQADGTINIEGINWVLNVTGEFETRLEIGISIRSASETLDFKKKVFRYPVVHLHNISQPPTPDEILNVWKEKWNIWTKSELREHIDCGVACQQVFQIMGGERWFKNPDTVRHFSTRRADIWSGCKQQDGMDAVERLKKGYEDRIVIERLDDGKKSEICRIYKGKPFKDKDSGKEECEHTDCSLKPGMLIYTAEECRYVPESGWRWHSCHMVMYAGDGNILDTILLKEPHLHKFRPAYVYVKTSRLVPDSELPQINSNWVCTCGKAHILFHKPVVLRIHDPFKRMR